MTSEVLYRKWRSRTFSELVGQDHVTTTLLNALSTGRVAHAYLFTGPRGTGKTSMARLMAKAINCLNNNGAGEPCNDCDVCLSVNEGRAMDVVEIDAASNSKVDDVRELIEKVDFKPSVGRKRIYIVDEVHMLSMSAFNALLKTLEEPPDHIVFILATTEAHKLPATIVSRCQRFDFRRIPLDAMVARLEYIAGEESIEPESGVLALLARESRGSLRDAANLLDQLIVFYGNSPEVSQARQMLGATEESQIEELVRHLADGEVGGGFATVQRLLDRGVDPKQLSRDVTEFLRDMLHLKAGGSISGRDDESIAAMEKIVARRSLGDLVRMLRIFAEADFRPDSPPSLPLELAIVEVCNVQATAGLAPSPPVAESHAEVKPSSDPEPAKPRGDDVPSTGTKPVDTHIREVESTTREPNEVDAPPAQPSASLFDSSDADAVRRKLVERLGEVDKMLQAILRSCHFISLSNEKLEIGCSSEFHKGKIDEPKARAIIEMELESLVGRVPEIVTSIRASGRGGQTAAPEAAPDGQSADLPDQLLEFIKARGGRPLPESEANQNQE